MCNLILGLLFLVFNPNFWNGLGTLFGGLRRAGGEIVGFMARASDDYANNMVTKMIDEGRLDPSEGKARYSLIRMGFVILFPLALMLFCMMISLLT